MEKTRTSEVISFFGNVLYEQGTYNRSRLTKTLVTKGCVVYALFLPSKVTISNQLEGSSGQLEPNLMQAGDHVIHFLDQVGVQRGSD